MKIAINANELCQIQTNGVKIYTYNILKYLAKKQFAAVIYYQKKIEKKWNIENTDLKHKLIKWPFLFWTHFRFPFELWRDKPDIFFTPIQTVPFFLPKCKIIVTIHDLAFLKFPNDFTYKDRLKLSWNTKRAVKKAKKIIAPSQATKNDIIKYYKIDAGKIEVVYEGVELKEYGIKKEKCHSQNEFGTGSEFISGSISKFEQKKSYSHFYRKENNRFRNKFGMTDSLYILFVGTIQPRKNIQGLIEAFELLKNFPNLLCKKGNDIKLVIVGGKGWLWKKVFKKAKKSKYKKDIIFTGQVSSEKLLEFYQNAEVFVLPSFYEGFGLPILEAMANGVPIIAGNNSSMIEIVGEAGILINPYNPEEITEAIKKIIQDKNFKEKLVKNGLEQAKKFTWEKCAKKTIKVLTDL